MMTVVAIGAIGTFALADDSFDSQSIEETMDRQSLYGHAEARLVDADGNIKAYTQSDNRIVNQGLDMLIINTFSPSSAFTGGIDTALGAVSHMQIGTGTSEATNPATNTITPIGGCAPVTFTANNATTHAITLSSTFSGATCAATVGEAGLFDGSTGSGTDDMFAQNAFASTIGFTASDSLDVDWTFTFTDN